MDSIIVTNGSLRPNAKRKAQQTLDGEYFISPPDKVCNGKPFYSRKFQDGTVQGVIFFDDGMDDDDDDDDADDADDADDDNDDDDDDADGDDDDDDDDRPNPRWKIHCNSIFPGWNLSQRVEDPSLPYPPLGQWEKWKGGIYDRPEQNDYQAIFTEGGVSVKPAKQKD